MVLDSGAPAGLPALIYGSDGPDKNDGRQSDPMIRKMHGMILAMSDDAD